MYLKLKNPTSQQYQLFKNFCLGPEIPWFYGLSTDTDENAKKGHMHSPYVGHSFIGRPEHCGYSNVESPFIDRVIPVMREIIDHNELPFLKKYIFIRAAVNCTWPNQGAQLSQPHVDHNFPHYNFIVYFTGDGETFIEKDSVSSCSINDEDVIVHSPKPHDAILFSGRHYMKLPSKDRRIILVATLIPMDNEGLDKFGVEGYWEQFKY